MRIILISLLIAVCVAPAAGKPGTGLVTRESLALAACRSAAAPYGKLVGKDLRLLDRHTFVISGTIAANGGGAQRELPNQLRKPRPFICKVTDQGQVLQHGFGDLSRTSLTPRPRQDSL